VAQRLRLEGVDFAYPLPGRDEAPALRGVDLVIEDGEVLCLAGSNGSGKSTLAQVCAGLLLPSAGTLRYGDTLVEGRAALRGFRRRAGMLFQNPEDQLFADTVEKDIAFGPRNHGLRGAELERRVRESAELVGLPLEELGTRSPFSLSGGEQRRAALAGVLALEPEVLVLDEPFIGLDYEGRHRLEEVLVRYRQERGATMIIVTHELSYVWAVSTTFGLLSEGRLLRHETRDELLSGDTDLAELGMQLPQWGALARELLSAGISVGDPTDPRSLASAMAQRREAAGGGH
jgi:energy-coupling factor transporter ATP-binding protein EcfA2